MTMTSRKNASVKALQSELATAKTYSSIARLEYQIAINTNAKRDAVYNQSELLELYAREDWSCEHGASKICHLTAHTGERFEHIVIKRHRNRRNNDLGNQLTAEIDCWCELSETADADFLCPILKYFKSKSDKVDELSETMKRNVIIIAQRAVYVGNAREACRMAEKLNRNNGYNGEDADERFRALKDLSDRRRWWDAIGNPGNSGVIFDYAKGCYKAVFIDYAL